ASEATRLAKRRLPVVCQPLGRAQSAPELQQLNYIFFYTEPKLPGSGFGAGLKQLVAALKTDQGWLRQHKRLLGFAVSWAQREREPALLSLRGSELEDAERWLARQPSGTDLGDLIPSFIRECRRAEEAGKRKDLRHARSLAWVMSGAASVAVCLAAFAIVQSNEATHARSRAEAAQARAEATRDDAAEVARIARRNYSNANNELINSQDNLIDWAPPSWAGYLYRSRASSHEAAGDFSKERADLDRALAFEPWYLPLLNSSANNYVNLGDAERAIAHAKQALELISTDAVYYGNLIIAEAMRRDYASALAHIDDALAKSQRTIDSTDSLVAPDIRDII